MLKQTVLAFLISAACGAAYGGEARPAALAGSPVYSDAAFQDYVETAFGYLNPSRAPRRLPAFRDAAAAPAQAGGRVFVAVRPSTRDLAGLLRKLGPAGFTLAGERTSYRAAGKRTVLLGWAEAGALKAIRGIAGVAAVSKVKGVRPARAF